MQRHDVGDEIMAHLEIIEVIERREGKFYRVGLAGMTGKDYSNVSGLVIREKDISENIDKTLEERAKEFDGELKSKVECTHPNTTIIDDKKYCIDCDTELEDEGGEPAPIDGDATQ